MLIWRQSLEILILALMLDAIIGDPDALWTRLPHPVALIGRMIEASDRRWNKAEASVSQRRKRGVLSLISWVALAAGLGASLQAFLLSFPFGWLATALLASILFAQRSLYEHVAQVRAAFLNHGLDGARIAVSRIVGRDPDALDTAGVSRAAIESCAENFSDGIVAPAFWFALFGLPGLFVYKTVNTADSMVGHRTSRHEAFGWASARTDDFLNLIPARLSGILLALGAFTIGGRSSQALAVMWRDAMTHRSPNAGWPESAAAGALGIALLGPRTYEGAWVPDPFLNREGRVAVPNDIGRMLQLFVAACGLEILFYAVLALSV